jgi:hypothetical protein
MLTSAPPAAVIEYSSQEVIRYLLGLRDEFRNTDCVTTLLLTAVETVGINPHP